MTRRKGVPCKVECTNEKEGRMDEPYKFQILFDGAEQVFHYENRNKNQTHFVEGLEVAFEFIDLKKGIIRPIPDELLDFGDLSHILDIGKSGMSSPETAQQDAKEALFASMKKEANYAASLIGTFKGICGVYHGHGDAVSVDTLVQKTHEAVEKLWTYDRKKGS